jgi:PmbA protein
VLAAATAGGATAAETDVSQAVGLSVTVRKGEVETISYNRDKGIGITIYIGQRRGHASSADFSSAAINASVGKALAIARYTAEDSCSGLADPDRLARELPELDLYHPWSLSVEDAIELGRETEAAALAVDPRITNSEGLHHRARRIGIRLRQHQRFSRRLSQLPPSHRLLGDR